jgi:hypothetical protein
MMAHYPQAATLFASAIRATAVVNSAGGAAENVPGARRVAVLLAVTATAGVAGDTFDVYVDVLAPDGATWLNACHLPQVTGDGGAQKQWAVLDSSNPGEDTVDASADAAAGKVRPALFGSQLRGRYTIVDAGAHGQSFTFALTALVQ